MPDRREDAPSRDRIDTIQETYEAFAARTSRILVAIFIVLFVSGVVSAYLVGQNSARIHEIQRSRQDSVRTSCREQNKRNRTAYRFLKALPPNPSQPKRSPAETRKLLHGFTDALVGPVRNCEDRVRELTQ